MTLAQGTFSNLQTPRGIAYDPVNSEFFVGNGGSTVTIYNDAGSFVSSVSQSTYGPYGPSGVAFDSTDGTIWIANFTGGSGANPAYGVAEYSGGGTLAQTLNPASTFPAPVSPTTELPYSIGYCAPPAASGAAYVAVGFMSDNSNNGVAEGGIYTNAGARVAAFSPQLRATALPNSISCSSTGLVYVAANDGLHLYSTTSAPGIGVEEPLPYQGFATLKAPIYGVYAAAPPTTLESPPAVFVVDSTDTLFAYDSAGNYLNEVSLGAPVGGLNGGGIALANGTVYVTVGPAQSGRVLAFNSSTLQPAVLPAGAFAGLASPVGIAYDPHNSRFYVADYAGNIFEYGADGAYIASAVAPDPVAIAFDSASDTLWVANYLGQSVAGEISEFTENLSPAQTINPATQFAAPGNLATVDDPVAVAYCATSGNPPSAANVVPVGFIGNRSGAGAGAAQTYTTTGSALGQDYAGPVTNPHAISCSSFGEVFVAADNGLLEYDVTGGSIGPAAGAYAKLTPPVYGVYVAY